MARLSAVMFAALLCVGIATCQAEGIASSRKLLQTEAAPAGGSVVNLLNQDSFLNANQVGTGNGLRKLLQNLNVLSGDALGNGNSADPGASPVANVLNQDTFLNGNQVGSGNGKKLLQVLNELNQDTFLNANQVATGNGASTGGGSSGLGLRKLQQVLNTLNQDTFGNANQIGSGSAVPIAGSSGGAVGGSGTDPLAGLTGRRLLQSLVNLLNQDSFGNANQVGTGNGVGSSGGSTGGSTGGSDPLAGLTGRKLLQLVNLLNQDTFLNANQVGTANDVGRKLQQDGTA